MRWQKSSYSNEQVECVEVAAAAGVVFLRESDEPEAVISPGTRALGALVRVTKGGELGR